MKPLIRDSNKKARHGTETDYSRGCHCQLCRDAHTAYMKEYYARPERVAAREHAKVYGLPRWDTRHGTRNAYNLGCRCKKCCAVHSCFSKANYASRDQKAVRQTRLALLQDPRSSFHGTTTGYNYGCRCVVCREAMRKYYTTDEYHKKTREMMRARRIANPEIHIVDRIRQRTIRAVDRIAKGKQIDEKWIADLGCTYATLRSYIETRFQKGMNWNNRGKNGWGPDHVIPCVCFDVTDDEQRRQCFHYTNLQPMWYRDNLTKNSAWGGKRQQKNRVLNSLK